METQTGINSYPYYCLGSDPTGKSFPDFLHTPAKAQLYEVIMVVVSRKFDRKYHTNLVFNLGPVVCESITLSVPLFIIGKPITVFIIYDEDQNMCLLLWITSVAHHTDLFLIVDQKS